MILHNEEHGTFNYEVKPESLYLLSKEELPQSEQAQIIPLQELKYSLEEDDTFISMVAEDEIIEYR